MNPKMFEFKTVTEDRDFKSGDAVKHFKGEYYRVLCFAKDTETGKDLVVYRSITEDPICWVREKEMFMSLVDKEKYPDIKQKYRFEKVCF